MRSLILVILAFFSIPMSAREAESTRTPVAVTAMPAGLTEDVVLCDVDANGTRDVVLLRAVDGFGQYVNVVALRNGGTGALADPVVTDSGLLSYGPNRVVCGRADQDSISDLIVGNGTDARVLRGSGNGSFAQYQSLMNASPVAMGFFNGDSFSDLFLSNPPTTVLRGDGDGAFLTPAAPSGLFGILADVTGDGRMDSVQTYSYPFRSYVNDGGGNVVLVQEDESVGEQAVVADFTGDGAADVLMSSYGAVSFRRGNGDGTFDPGLKSTISPLPFGSWYAHKAEARDVDADGILDFTYGFRAYLSDGAGSFKSRLIQTRDAGDVFSRWGDMNGDGRADLVLVDRNSAAVQIIASTPPTASRVPTIAFMRSESSVSYAQQVTYRAQVAGAVPLSGAVRFRVNGATVGLVDVDAGGVAELTFGLPRGATTVIVTYTGDPEYAEASATMSFEVLKAPTSVSIYPDRNPRNVYQTVQIFTGLYVDYSHTGFPGPTGSLEITRDGMSLGAPDGDSGRLVTSFPEAGERTVRAEYAGDENYLGSFAEYVQIVEKGTAPFSVRGPEGIVQGSPAAVTVHVGGGEQNQTGTVVFMIDGVVAATQALTGHSVTVELTFPAAGVRLLKVAYSGDANWVAQETTLTVNVASTAWLVRPVLSASARTGEAKLQWNTIPEATAYVVWRKLYFYDPWQPVATVAAPNTMLTMAQVASTNAYAVSATKADGAASLLSIADIATTNLLGAVTAGTLIDDLQIQNLLDRFRDVYAFAGLYMQSPSLDVTNGSVVRAADFQTLRNAAQYIRGQLGLPVPTFTDPVLTPGQSVIRAIHLNELKDALD